MHEIAPTDSETMVLVELKQRSDVRGTTDVSITPINIVEKSTEALNKAMGTIKIMANRVIDAVGEIPISKRPHEIEVEFGLKLTTDANALIVNAGAEAHFTVKMKWSRKTEELSEYEEVQ